MRRTVSARAGGRPIVVGHRGAAGIAPENTRASFTAALDCGAEWIELDVRFTRDGEPVVIHDETLERTTDGTGPVREIKLAGIAGLDAGRWFDGRFAGERVPTLGQALACISGRAGVNIEVKDCGEAGSEEGPAGRVLPAGEGGVAAGPGRGPGFGSVATAVSRILAEVRSAGTGPVLVSSFEEAIVKEVLRQGGPAGLLAKRWVRDPVARARSCGASTIVLSIRKATARRVARAHGEGLSAWIYTVNQRDVFDRAVAAGYDAIIGDRPDRLLAWRSGIRD